MELEPIHTRAWRHVAALPEIDGAVALVTGGNRGLGLALVRLLAAKGARVILACRDVDAGEAARAAVVHERGKAEVEVRELDLDSLDSVRAFAEGVRAQEPRVDLVFAHAGLMALHRQETEDGFERQLGVNHLGHFALVGRLLPALAASPEARVVATTSGVAYSGHVDLVDPMGETRYDRWRAYGQAKLANILFTNALHRRFGAAGWSARAHAAHPGLVPTNLQRRVPRQDVSWLERAFLHWFTPTVGQSTGMGALPLLHAALRPDAAGADLWGPRWFHMRGAPRRVRQPGLARDVTLQDALWERSVAWTGVRYGL